MRCTRFLCAAMLACLLLVNMAAAETLFEEHSFEDAFLPEGTEWTENSYRSQNLAVEITTARAFDSDIYVADVKLRTVESLQRSLGGDKWKPNTIRLEEHAEKSGAIIALTGDNGHYLNAGWAVCNGTLHRERGNYMRDLCVVYTDGSMQTHYAKVDYDLIGQQTAEGIVWQTFVFGPALLDENGKAKSDFSNSDVNPKNPRAVIGYYAPGHYCLVQVDGRGMASQLTEGKFNYGMTLGELAQFMEKLGCKAAYNLDGGQTAALWFKDGIISNPYKNGRAMGDAIVICEPGNRPEAIDDFLVE